MYEKEKSLASATRTRHMWRPAGRPTAGGYEIIKTIEARSTYAQEDWLIIISTDHGGTGTSHGGQTPFERMTWLACNKAVECSEENKTFALTK